MRYLVMYRHPVNGNNYYFVDLRNCGGNLLPIGCFHYRRKTHATVFETLNAALQLSSYLDSLGYESQILQRKE